jgi:dTMP kinase
LRRIEAQPLNTLSEPRRFIVFEGGEGAGKSTQARLLAEALQKRGHNVVLTREPGGTPAGERIRALLVNGETTAFAPMTEALLINAARAEHLEKVIRPALERGKWVICDRFADSTMAYQGYGQGADRAALSALRKLVVGDTEPGLTLIFDLPSEFGLARAQTYQRYERMGREFHERLRQAFFEISRAKDAHRRLIDASGSLDEVHAIVTLEVRLRYGVEI